MGLYNMYLFYWNELLGGVGSNVLSLFESQYLTAGLVYLFMSGVGGLGWIATAMVAGENRRFNRKFLLIYVVLGILVGCIFAMLAYSVIYVAWSYMTRTKPWPGFDYYFLEWIVVNTSAMVLLTTGGIYSYRKQSGFIWLLIGLLLLAWALSIFGANVYIRIPDTYGGGSVHRVQIIVDQKRAELLKHVGVNVTETTSMLDKGKQLYLSDFINLVAVGSDSYIFNMELEHSTVSQEVVLKKDQVIGVIYSEHGQ